MIRRPPRSTQGVSSAASDVYKRQVSTQSTWGILKMWNREPSKWEQRHNFRLHLQQLQRLQNRSYRPPSFFSRHFDNPFHNKVRKQFLNRVEEENTHIMKKLSEIVQHSSRGSLSKHTKSPPCGLSPYAKTQNRLIRLSNEDLFCRLHCACSSYKKCEQLKSFQKHQEITTRISKFKSIKQN
eukprot:TRINITY_DN1763_c0_g1_i4.p1 TRINITY_DN1763_c0_g1~~TRINITY_DN1763_c0_g1_i4.p1  ORF type:complete len:182 (-),score=31.34 TRINITY_DN1763_c0_g1_i4:245-790(-)